MLRKLLARIFYRFWQFKQVLLPKLVVREWLEAVAVLDEPLRHQLARLKKSEKAHVMRVYTDICQAHGLPEDVQKCLLELALLHDIGKTVTRPSLLFKVAKVLFPIANTGHCIEGARLLRRFHQNRQLIRRVLRHHDETTSDPILRMFQEFDDRN